MQLITLTGREFYASENSGPVSEILLLPTSIKCLVIMKLLVLIISSWLKEGCLWENDLAVGFIPNGKNLIWEPELMVMFDASGIFWIFTGCTCTLLD